MIGACTLYTVYRTKYTESNLTRPIHTKLPFQHFHWIHTALQSHYVARMYKSFSPDKII